jgi:allophanate hydrolase subunit 1
MTIACILVWAILASAVRVISMKRKRVFVVCEVKVKKAMRRRRVKPVIRAKKKMRMKWMVEITQGTTEMTTKMMLMHLEMMEVTKENILEEDEEEEEAKDKRRNCVDN